MAWNVNITDGGFTGLARGRRLFVSGCQINGEPVTREHIWLGDPAPQPD